MLLKCYELIKLLRYLGNYRAAVVGMFTGQGGKSGCYIGNRRGKERGFKLDLGVERLKGRLGKCRWDGFGVVKFVGNLEIRVIKLGKRVIYSGV